MKPRTAFIWGLYSMSLGFALMPPITAAPSLLDWIGGTLLGAGLALGLGSSRRRSERT